MTRRNICSLWTLLAAITLSQLWRGSTGLVPNYVMEMNTRIFVQEGLNVTIFCNFTADGKNKFRDSFGYWYCLTIDGTDIVATNDVSTAGRKANFKLTGNPDSGDCTLTITGAKREDEGVYYFRFEESKNSNVKYSYIEMATAITVTEPPRNMKITITSSKGEEHPASQPVDIDLTETLTLVCMVDVNPTVTVAWVKGEFGIEISKRSGFSAMINVTSSMADVYRCLAWNAIGVTEQRILVGMKTVPLLKDPQVIAGLLTDPKEIAGLIIGIIIVVSAIILGIVFLVRRKQKTESTEPSTLTHGPPDGMRSEEDIYANMPVGRASGERYITAPK